MVKDWLCVAALFSRRFTNRAKLFTQTLSSFSESTNYRLWKLYLSLSLSAAPSVSLYHLSFQRSIQILDKLGRWIMQTQTQMNSGTHRHFEGRGLEKKRAPEHVFWPPRKGGNSSMCCGSQKGTQAQILEGVCILNPKGHCVFWLAKRHIGTFNLPRGHFGVFLLQKENYIPHRIPKEGK